MVANTNHSHVRNTPSKRFTRILNNAPVSAQRQILEQAIIPLLDKVPPTHAKRVIGCARNLAKKSEQIPQVDMSVKKQEIQGLFEELQKESKFSSRSGGSRHEALLLEAIESIAEWLNDLWSLAVEFGLDFPRVHSGLLTSVSVLGHVRSLKGGSCHCVFSTIYVPVTIRDRSGKVIKEFNELGIANVESAILWIWRDVFLALLASKNQVYVKLMPELLAEIDDEIGWSGLERLVLGGATYFEDGYDQTSADPAYPRLRRPDEVGRVSRTSSEENEKEDMYYAEHWNYKFVKQVPRLRQLVQQRMVEVFKASPSVLLYTLVLALSPDVQSVRRELHEILSWLAPVSTSSLATALGIYCTESKFDEVASLLETHAFLLRPRETYAIQESVRALATSHKQEHREIGLRVAEKELLDTLETIRHAVLGPFARLDVEESRSEVRQIFRLSAFTTERQERVRRLVEAVSTPGMGAVNPMAVAAMMMGMPIPIPIPVPPQEGEGAGFNDAAEAALAAATAAVAAGAGNVAEGHIGMLDLDPHDPDFSELHEETKPDLKGRFEGWVETVKFFGYLRAATILGEGDLESVETGKKTLQQHADEVVKQESEKGEAVLRRVYNSMYSLIPWVFGGDLVNEMISKLIDKPSNHHICEALRCLSTFVETQKRKQWKELYASHMARRTERFDDEARVETDDAAPDAPGGDAHAEGDEHGPGVPSDATQDNHFLIEEDDTDSEDDDRTELGHSDQSLEDEIASVRNTLANINHPIPNSTFGDVSGQDDEDVESIHSDDSDAAIPGSGPAMVQAPGPTSFFEHVVQGSLEDVD